MVDYDQVFSDDLDKKFFYTDYPGTKMVVGKISLEKGGVIVELTNKRAIDMCLKYLQGTKINKKVINIYELEK